MNRQSGVIAEKANKPHLISLHHQQQPQSIQPGSQEKRKAKKPTKPKKVSIGSEFKRSIMTINGVSKEV